MRSRGYSTPLWTIDFLNELCLTLCAKRFQKPRERYWPPFLLGSFAKQMLHWFCYYISLLYKRGAFLSCQGRRTEPTPYGKWLFLTNIKVTSDVIRLRPHAKKRLKAMGHIFLSGNDEKHAVLGSAMFEGVTPLIGMEGGGGVHLPFYGLALGNREDDNGSGERARRELKLLAEWNGVQGSKMPTDEMETWCAAAC